MLSLASASLSFQASAPLTAPNTLARRANVVASDQDQIGFQNPDQLRSDAASAKSSGEFCYGLVGTVAPFEEGFDPFNLSPGASYDQVRTWREAELAHGRVGMLASAGFIVQEKFHPLFTGDGGPAIDQFAKLPVIMWPLITIFIGGCESLRILASLGVPQVDSLHRLRLLRADDVIYLLVRILDCLHQRRMLAACAVCLDDGVPAAKLRELLVPELV